GRKTGWSGADDDDVAQVTRVDAHVEAEMVCDLLIARPLQYRLAAADHHGYIGPVHVEAIQQVLHVGVMVKVEILEGVAVTGEQFLDAKGRRGSTGADEQRVANPLCHHGDASMNQGPHEHVADLGVCLNEGVHLVTCQLDDFARFTDAQTRLRRTTEDHADVPGELSRTENRDEKVAKARRANDLDFTSLQHKKRYVRLTALDQDFSANDGTSHAVRGDSR